MKSISAAFALSVLVSSFAAADDWPQWRGPERNGVSQEKGLLQEWPEGGPTLRWKAGDIGTGYSSPAIVDGRVFVQTTGGDAEFALCLDEKTGQQIWLVAIGKVGVNRGPQYPGTRSTPTIDGGLAYCLASAGELACLDTADGKVKWRKHLKDDFGGEDGAWAYSESVLVDGEAVICTPGGTESPIVALNKYTGDVIWKSAIPDIGSAEYASIMPVAAGSSRQYVQFLRKGLVGVDAQTGKFLWRYDHTVDQGANILTPLVHGNRIFSAGSRSGGGQVQLEVTGDEVIAKEVYFDRALSSSIGGAVLVDGNMFATSSQVMFCADFETGKVNWTDRAVGAASICVADGRLYVRGHTEGIVALVEPTAEGYREKGRLEQPERSDTRAWPHPVVSNGGLYLRDQGNLFCYDVTAK